MLYATDSDYLLSTSFFFIRIYLFIWTFCMKKIEICLKIYVLNIFVVLKYFVFLWNWQEYLLYKNKFSKILLFIYDKRFFYYNNSNDRKKEKSKHSWAHLKWAKSISDILQAQKRSFQEGYWTLVAMQYEGIHRFIWLG